MSIQDKDINPPESLPCLTCEEERLRRLIRNALEEFCVGCGSLAPEIVEEFGYRVTPDSCETTPCKEHAHENR